MRKENKITFLMQIKKTYILFKNIKSFFDVNKIRHLLFKKIITFHANKDNYIFYLKR